MFRALGYYARRIVHGLLSGPYAILWLLLAPFRWIGRMFAQLAHWWSSRESRYLLRGLPALAAFVGAALLLLAGRMRSDTVLAERYLSAARFSAASQPDVAALLLERVVQLRPKDNETLFELATMTQRAGDPARTAVLMRELAPDPDTAPGYWPAHLEMGKSYLKIQNLAPANFVKAKEHFDQVLALNRDNAEAYAYLGQLHYGQRMWDEAIQYFEQALEHGQTENGEIRADLQVVLLLLAKAYSFRNDLQAAGGKTRPQRARSVRGPRRATTREGFRVADHPGRYLHVSRGL
jgi:tetratricopeptide (TPR) repeat protein